ncbi:YhjD/YihY/BrkB family envelope integrity protein [Thermodesulfatator atlanticus]|uniref:YhjD/YihY/BrkB family envelope integrity protein n=1 Tax=Thermodesulfatator atlanticus TaxID=501497 RepID=UPI0003B4FA19|nr:YhjD/YihY/BrkB family envelope integrity protein [Thermodesulfatator atlanticus]
MSQSVVILFKETLRRFWHDKCLMSAQALTYNTVFAFVPLLAFGLSIVQVFIGAEEITTRINDALSQFLNPGALSKAQETILNLVQEAQHAPLGAASMILFLTMVIGLLMQFEEVINEIFRVKQKRSIFQKIIVYWMGLTLGPILVTLPLGASIYLTHLGLKGYGLVSFLLKFWMIPTLMLLFAGIYLYLPAKRIKFKAAFAGATIAATLWIILASLYAFYTTKAVAYSKLYGSLAVIPLFLLWLWLNWVLVLLGAEIASVLHYKEKILAHFRTKNDTSSLLLALGALLCIYDHLHQGEEAPTLVRISSLLNCSPFHLEDVLENLIKNKLIYEFENRFYLAKDAEALELKEVQEAIEGKLPIAIPETPLLKPPYEFLLKEKKLWEGKSLKHLYQKTVEERTKYGALSEVS